MAKKSIGYNGNNKLKKPGSQVSWTEEMWMEWGKCLNDPVYFTENYIKIINLNDGLVNFRPYDYQKQIIDTIHNERFTIVLTGRQSGKCFEENQLLTIRNKITGEIMSISAKEFGNIVK